MGYIEQTLWPPATAIRAAREGRIFRLDSVAEGHPRASIARAVGIGALAGLVYFVPFRFMMRLVSEEHVFSWAGTLAILVYCLLVGAVTGVLYAGRQRAWRARSRLVPAVLCTLLLCVFFVFFVPAPLVAALLLLASEKTGWRARTRFTFAGLGAAIVLALAVLVTIYQRSAWGLGADIAGFAMLVPHTVVLGIPLNLALTRRRPSEFRAEADQLTVAASPITQAA